MRVHGAGSSSLREVSWRRCFRALEAWGPGVPRGSSDSLGQEDGRPAGDVTHLQEDGLPLWMGAAEEQRSVHEGR